MATVDYLSFRFEEAEKLVEEVLSDEPNHAFAMCIQVSLSIQRSTPLSFDCPAFCPVVRSHFLLNEAGICLHCEQATAKSMKASSILKRVLRAADKPGTLKPHSSSFYIVSDITSPQASTCLLFNRSLM